MTDSLEMNAAQLCSSNHPGCADAIVEFISIPPADVRLNANMSHASFDGEEVETLQESEENSPQM